MPMYEITDVTEGGKPVTSLCSGMVQVLAKGLLSGCNVQASSILANPPNMDSKVLHSDKSSVFSVSLFVAAL
jgi:hypothetical protein